MNDRLGNRYEKLTRPVNTKNGWTHVLSLRLSPARQAKKARGLSGRQEVKWRKAQRRSK